MGGADVSRSEGKQPPNQFGGGDAANFTAIARLEVATVADYRTLQTQQRYSTGGKLHTAADECAYRKFEDSVDDVCRCAERRSHAHSVSKSGALERN